LDVHIALLDDYQNVGLSYAPWRESLPDSSVVAFTRHIADPCELASKLQPFDAIVAMRERTVFSRALLEQLPNLRLLVTTSNRNAAVDLVAASDLGVTVCGTRHGGPGTAELTWGLILALARHICAENASIRRGRWQSTVGTELAGRTLGLVGLGRVGSRVARIASAFDMRVIAWSPHLTPARAASAGAVMVSKHELFVEADFVSLHLVLSETTRNIVGAAELGMMKKSAFVVNTSRAAIIDLSSLAEALLAGRIAGAGLDVFPDEPLPADHGLLGVPNTVLTPHLGFVTDAAYRIYYADALEDVAAFCEGAPVRLVSISGGA
jgi:phosphoglycerate dehydrogenase-like enzyme